MFRGRRSVRRVNAPAHRRLDSENHEKRKKYHAQNQNESRPTDRKLAITSRATRNDHHAESDRPILELFWGHQWLGMRRDASPVLNFHVRARLPLIETLLQKLTQAGFHERQVRLQGGLQFAIPDQPFVRQPPVESEQHGASAVLRSIVRSVRTRFLRRTPPPCCKNGRDSRGIASGVPGCDDPRSMRAPSVISR